MKLKGIVTLIGILFTVIAPVQAETKDIVSDELTIIVPPFVNIVQQNADAAVVSTENTINGSNLTLGKPITPVYEIVTNEDMTVHLSATAKTVDGEVNAMHGDTANSMVIVFTKSDGSTTSSAVQNCTSGNAKAKDNPNAIAFVLKCNDPIHTENCKTDVKIDGDRISYDLSRGTTVLSYSISGNSIDGTFSPADTAGTYKATLIISDVDP